VCYNKGVTICVVFKSAGLMRHVIECVHLMNIDGRKKRSKKMLTGKITIIGGSKKSFIAELVKMAKSEDSLKRCLAASAAQTPQKVLLELCSDPDPIVRWCVLRNNMAPKTNSKEFEVSDKNETYMLSYRFSVEKSMYWAELEVITS